MQTNTPAMQRKHITALDGVRGLAVLLVIVFHYGGGAQSSKPLIRMMGDTVRFGWSGVSLFFVLSGFLITGILWDARGKPHWWKNFYIRRSLRIFPLYIVALLLAACFAHWHGEVLNNLRNFAVYGVYLQNYPKIFPNSLDTRLRLYHFWSLAVEEQFYLVWPFIIQLFPSRSSAKRFCIAVVVGSLIFRLAGVHYQFVDNSQLTLSRVGELAAGAWLSLSFRGSEHEWRRIVAWAPWCAIGSVLAIIGIAVVDHGFDLLPSLMVTAGLAVLAVLGSSMIVLAISGNRFRRVMETGWLCWLGTISYGLYIYHVLFLAIYRDAAVTLLGARSQAAIAAGAAAIGLPCTLVIATLSFRYVETPFLKLKNRFSNGPKRKAPTSVQHIST